MSVNKLLDLELTIHRLALHCIVAAYLKDRKPWIVKPVASSRGRGIYLVNHVSVNFSIGMGLASGLLKMVFLSSFSQAMFLLMIIC